MGTDIIIFDFRRTFSSLKFKTKYIQVYETGSRQFLKRPVSIFERLRCHLRFKLDIFKLRKIVFEVYHDETCCFLKLYFSIFKRVIFELGYELKKKKKPSSNFSCSTIPHLDGKSAPFGYSSFANLYFDLKIEYFVL